VPSYQNSKIIENILRGELDAVPYDERYVKTYLARMALRISETCKGAHFSRREADQLRLDATLETVDMTEDGGLMALYNAFLNFADLRQAPGKTLRAQSLPAMDMQALPQEADADAASLVARHPCGSRDLDEFSAHARSFVANEDAPRLAARELMQTCVQNAHPTGRYRGADFCGCFVATLTGAPLSRAARKGLTSDFWSTAQHLMATEEARYGRCEHGWQQ
jgi:hypothetical protein